jgi:hypothetical protein
MFKKVDWFWVVVAAACLMFGDAQGGEPKEFIFYAGLLILVMAAGFLCLNGICSTINALGTGISKTLPEEDKKSYRDYIRSRGREPLW